MIVSGPAGSGKGTIVKLLRQTHPEIGLSVSETTREPRKNEREGINYFFVSREQFEKDISEKNVIEHTIYCGNYYGTPRKEIERVIGSGQDLILEIEVDGACQIKELYPDSILVMLIPPNIQILRKRLKGRNTETEESMNKRLERATQEIRKSILYDYIVVNETDKESECSEKVASIISAEHNKRIRMNDFIENFFD